MTNSKIGWNLETTYTKLPDKFFSIIDVNPVSYPELIVLNSPLADSLGLNGEALAEQEGVKVLAGNSVPEDGASLAQAYAGHQFGHFTMLGDGRALLIGEQLTPEGKRFDLQLKGSGRTPYSRGGDGRATLGPMLREYIISEAMHGLGIPTTRSLAVVTTGEPVYREKVLPGAILTRVAASHLRVGTFEFARQWTGEEGIKALTDYAIHRHYPEAAKDDKPYLAFLHEVIKIQAELIAKWQLVGFIHGVMNTDNMTICGETIDYGPCAFMNQYDPKTVFSSIDRQGRYAYGNQPYIGGWNLARLAETLVPLLHEDDEEGVKLAQTALEGYSVLFREAWMKGMAQKLGLKSFESGDETLFDQLLSAMEKYSADFTNTFRSLTLGELEGAVLFKSAEFVNWYSSWQKRLEKQEDNEETVKDRMQRANPSVIPRNHRVEEALEAAVENDDMKVMESLLEVITDPYSYNEAHKNYCEVPTDDNYQTFCGT
ncbi:MAG: YdiU family protein [Bacillus sp. (in: Bacteria)]|nr:YdiU family protein [Bacillus sp. (in: firmicutes)]